MVFDGQAHVPLLQLGHGLQDAFHHITQPFGAIHSRQECPEMDGGHAGTQVIRLIEDLRQHARDRIGRTRGFAVAAEIERALIRRVKLRRQLVPAQQQAQVGSRLRGRPGGFGPYLEPFDGREPDFGDRGHQLIDAVKRVAVYTNRYRIVHRLHVFLAARSWDQGHCRSSREGLSRAKARPRPRSLAQQLQFAP